MTPYQSSVDMTICRSSSSSSLDTQVLLLAEEDERGGTWPGLLMGAEETMLDVLADLDVG